MKYKKEQDTHMKKTKINFFPVQEENRIIPTEGLFHTVLRTRHGRRVYLLLEQTKAGDAYTVRECEYVDRARFAVPHKLMTREIPERILSDVLRNELDCCASECSIGNEVYRLGNAITKEELLAHARWEERLYLLIFLRIGDCLFTCFKNRHRRAISLWVKPGADGDEKAVITRCYYCDIRGTRADRPRTPHGLVTIAFDYNLNNLLEIVNRELEGGFSGIVTANDFEMPSIDHPFCGRI